MPTVLFRFSNLNKLQKMTLEKEVQGAFSVFHEASNSFDGYVALDELTFDDINMFVVRQQLPVSRCNIVIKMSVQDSPFESALPATVNQMLKHIDCQISCQLS